MRGNRLITDSPLDRSVMLCVRPWRSHSCRARTCQKSSHTSRAGSRPGRSLGKRGPRAPEAEAAGVAVRHGCQASSSPGTNPSAVAVDSVLTLVERAQ